MRFMMLMIPKGYEKATPGAMPDAKPSPHDEVQRRAAEGRRAAGARRPAPPSMGARVSFPGGKPKVTAGLSPRRRRCSRLLDDPGEIEREAVEGQALPRFRDEVIEIRRSKSSRTSRPTCRRPRPAFPRCRPNPGSAKGS